MCALPSPTQAPLDGYRSLRDAPSLEPRNNPWIRNCVLCVTGGVVSAALGPILDLDTAIAWGGAALGVGAGAAVSYNGYRATIRAEETDRAIEQLCRLTAAPPTREVMTATRWSGQGPGRPGRITVRYQSAALLLDEQWEPRVVELLSQQNWGRYRIQKHNTRKRRLVLVPDTRSISETHLSPELVKATRTILALLGPTGKITKHETDPSTGDLLAVEATHEVGHRLESEGYRARVQRVVSVNLPGRWRARWNLETDWVRFEVRPTFPKKLYNPAGLVDEKSAVDLSDLAHSDYDSVAISYGEDEDGNPMVWRPAIDPHFMLVGASGTGKTVTAHTLLTQLTAHGWPVWVVDGKGVEFLGFQDWPNVQIVASHMEHQIAVIHRFWKLMETRYSLIVNGEATEADFEPVVLFIDEYADFRGNLLNWYSSIKGKGDPTKPKTLQEVASIGRKGRTAKCHMVLGTQRPDAEYFGGDMRDNFRQRVSMGRLSPQGAMMMWESATTGVGIPRGCRGRATSVNDHNQAVEIQTYFTPDPRKTAPDTEDAAVLDRLRPLEVRHERLVILDPDPGGTEDGEEEIRFHHVTGAPWARAADHPNLDPVARRKTRADSETARRASSPMAMLNLDTPAVREPAHDSQTSKEEHAVLVPASPVRFDRPHLQVVPDSDSDVDDWEGYGESEDTAPVDLVAGDLILLDEDAGIWVVVDNEPAIYGDDSGDDMVGLTWRGDGDAEGVLDIPLDVTVQVRRPLALAT